MQGAEPELTVVIAAHNAVGVIVDCLEALARQVDPPRTEVIVADSSLDGTAELLRGKFPEVRLLHFDAPLTIPELRGRAIAEARGSIIAVVDPYSIVAHDWARCTVAAHARLPHLVIGGSVDMHRAADRPGLLAWTLYFNEYGMFMPPITGGPASILPGSNVSYKRSHLFDGERPRHPVFWKTFVNVDAQAQGSALWLEPTIRVALHKPVPFGDYLRTRYLHGRCFAGMRVTGAGWQRRLLRAGSTPLVPLLLCARWTRAIWPKRRERLNYLCTLPLQIVLFSMWAIGELCGYLFGQGRACSKLYY